MRVSPKLAISGLIALLTIGSASQVLAEPEAWDQGAVTSTAQDLAKATDAWWLAIREQPGEQVGSGDSQQMFGLVQKAEVLQEQSRALADHLAKGDGHDKTRNMYRSIKEIVDYSQIQVSQSELDEPTLAAWNKVTGLINQLAPYYGVKASE
jgi:hypothetical protein